MLLRTRLCVMQRYVADADISCYIHHYITNSNEVLNILYMTKLLLCTYIDNTYIICYIICYIKNDIKVHS